jgi:hypothetical protein
MTTPYYDVVFATPGNSLHPEYVKSLVETIKYLQSAGLTYHFVNQFSSFVPSARENTATDSSGADWEATAFGAGKFNYGRIFWVDSDISWSVEAFKTLLETDLDICSGMMPVSRDGRIGAMRLNSDGNPISLNSLEFLVASDPELVDGVSFGFLAIKAGVFEVMNRPWFDIRYASIEGAKYPVLFGEDYSWCLKAKESGFDIWLHSLVRVEHHKSIILTV